MKNIEMLTIVRGILNTIQEENLAVTFTNQMEDIHKMECYLNEAVQKENAKSNGSGNLLKAVKTVLKTTKDNLKGVCHEDSEGRKYYTNNYIIIRSNHDLSIGKSEGEFNGERVFYNNYLSEYTAVKIPTLKEIKNMKDECKAKIKLEGRKTRNDKYIIKLADHYFRLDFIITAIEATGSDTIYVNSKNKKHIDVVYFKSDDGKTECGIMPINRSGLDNEGFENNTVRFAGTFLRTR